MRAGPRLRARFKFYREVHTSLLAASLLAMGSMPVTAQQTVATPSSPAVNDTTSPRVLLPADGQRYRLKLRDVVSIQFPLTPELNQTVTVQPDGYISLSGAPNLFVAGLTVPELEGALKRDYAATLHQPLINVDLKDVQRPFFTITGQVGKPGEYELRSDINVAEAVAKAGGLMPTATYQIYVFHRSGGDAYNVQKIDLKRLLKGKNLSDSASIRPGDMIVVPESGITTFRKYVPYSIGASYFPTN